MRPIGCFVSVHIIVYLHNLILKQTKINKMLRNKNTYLVVLLLFPITQYAQEIIHYFHFNQLSGTVQSVESDFSLTAAKATIQYRPINEGVASLGSMDDVAGSALNAHLNTAPGRGLRVRNPSDSMEMIIALPTNGVENVKFTYAVQRTNNGMLNQLVEVSQDGEFFETFGDPIQIVEIAGFQFIELDFSGLSFANNNKDFVIKIKFSGQSNQLNGNNRFDNMVLYGDLLEAESEIIAYWHFNDLNTSLGDVKEVSADSSVHKDLALPSLRYTGVGARDMDRFEHGTVINSKFGQVSGGALRVRNPSIGRYLLLECATIGYGQIQVSFAVQRSGSGMLNQHYEYTVDGINFLQADLNVTEMTIYEDYQQIVLDFSSIHKANNNPDFKVRISFTGNEFEENGNNRFDNFSVTAFEDLRIGNVVSLSKAPAVRVYPNPANDLLCVLFADQMDVAFVRLLDLSGREVGRSSNDKIQITSLKSGLYFCEINTYSKKKYIVQFLKN